MIITICNFKGGVGKTTTCHAIATAKGIDKKKVLMIDLDGQHSLTTSCGIDVNKFSKNTITINDLLMAEIKHISYDIQDIQEAIIKLNNVDIIPSTKTLTFCDRELALNSGRVDVLKNIISKIKTQYDYIFIDCSPTRNLICENALITSDSVLIPVESYYLGSEGLYDFIELLSDINNKFKTNIYIEGIILTMFQNTNLCKNIKEYIIKAIKGKGTNYNRLKEKDIRIFDETIPRSIKVGEAGLYGKSIIEYAPKNIVAQQYIKIASQIK